MFGYHCTISLEQMDSFVLWMFHFILYSALLILWSISYTLSYSIVGWLLLNVSVSSGSILVPFICWKVYLHKERVINAYRATFVFSCTFVYSYKSIFWSEVNTHLTRSYFSVLCNLRLVQDMCHQVHLNGQESLICGIACRSSHRVKQKCVQT